jgi:hypothetical protein
MGLKLILVVAAVVMFGLAFFNVGKFNWTAGGFCLLTIAFGLM